MEQPCFFVGTSRQTSRPRLEMTSYSDNGYDVINYFCCFGKFLAYTVPTRFHCCQMRNDRIRLGVGGGGGAFCPPSVTGVSQTPSKIGLMVM